MRWGVLVGMVVGRGACTAAPLTRLPHWRRNCAPRTHPLWPQAPERPQARTTPADRQTLQEVGKHAPSAWSPRE